jgi:hypothetical protein
MMRRRIPPRKPPTPPSHRQPDADQGPPNSPGRLLDRLADPVFREEFLDADLVFGDVIAPADVGIGKDARGTGDWVLFFGLVDMKRSHKAGTTVNLRAAVITVDFATDDVETLCAACMSLKGSCCYYGEETINPSFN